MSFNHVCVCVALLACVCLCVCGKWEQDWLVSRITKKIHKKYHNMWKGRLNGETESLLWCLLGSSKYSCCFLCLCMFTGVLICHTGGHCEHLPAVQKHWFFSVFFWNRKRERIWTSSGEHHNSYSLSWPWFPFRTSVTAICTLSSCSNLWPLLALLNKRGDWRQKYLLGSVPLSTT